MFIPFIHRPLSRYVNALADVGLTVQRMEEPAPPPGFLARAAEYEAAATIPRLLFLRCEKRHHMSEFVIITGLSGAGRSQAADDLEDLGWFVIDNLPTELIPKVVELVRAPSSDTPRVALVVGAGARHAELLARPRRPPRVRRPGAAALPRGEHRRARAALREHPAPPPAAVPGEGLAEAIERERALLEPVRAEADVVVDTSDLNVHELRDRIVGLFGETDLDAGMQTRVVSFGYKHGLPVDVDVVLDCRFLPNPHWVEELRPLTGLDEPVRDYVLGQPAAAEFLRAPRAAARPAAPGLRGRGQGLPHHRLRLHRRPAPVGGDRRGGGRRSCRARDLRAGRAAPRHREVRSTGPSPGLERDRPICSDEPTTRPHHPWNRSTPAT